MSTLAASNQNASEGNQDRRRELAAFLTRLRAEAQPAQLGLRGGGRRRVPGLRRHELADLAGISLTWYTWLEQGRNINISGDALDGIASALQLSDDLRQYLRVLGDCPITRPPEVPHAVDASLRALIDDLMPAPVAITAPSWDLLAWNRAWAEVFIDPLTLLPRHRNGLWITFMSPSYRKRVIDWESEARYALARHREITGPYSADPRIKALHAELGAESSEFQRLWDLQLVQGFAGRIQMMQHPEAGLLKFKLIQLKPVDSQAIKLVVRRPADEATARKLRKLLKTGT